MIRSVWLHKIPDCKSENCPIYAVRCADRISAGISFSR